MTLKSAISRETSIRTSFIPRQEILAITKFIQETVKSAGAEGVVLGLSGGIDSAVVAALSAKAMGPKRVLGVKMFEDRYIRSQDAKDASRVAKQLRIKLIEFRLTPIIDSYMNAFGNSKVRLSKIALANIKARSRMTTLYALANQKKLLVAGTGDRSEILVGYFTKFGDGAADLLPISHLYKTEVRALGAALRLPYEVVTKPSSPNLWPGHLASQELPAEYDVMDRVLVKLFEQKLSTFETAKNTGTTAGIVRRVIQMNKASEHKRELPASLL